MFAGSWDGGGAGIDCAWVSVMFSQNSKPMLPICQAHFFSCISRKLLQQVSLLHMNNLLIMSLCLLLRDFKEQVLTNIDP